MPEEHKLEAQVLTPEGEVFTGDLFQVSTRTAVGEVGIRARHAPMVARLVPCELRLHSDAGSEPDTWAQGEGWLEVFANRVRVLVAETHRPDDLDVSELKERLSAAEESLAGAEEGSAAAEQAERERDRAEAFIEIAEAK